ncbi:MAG: hypothetical protein J6T15_05235 [Bacilli bacterium]|nr:hypothetical protein [Bacilli bacterium]
MLNEFSLLTVNYEKVLDLLRPVKDKDEVISRRKEISNLIFERDIEPKELDSFNIYWNSLSDKLFDIKTIDDFNINVFRFLQYILSVEEEFKDHGFSLLVVYFIKLCDTYLSQVDNFV